MYAVLNRFIALRSWQLVPYAYITKNSATPQGLKKEEFEILLLADGEHDIPENEAAEKLIESGFIEKCEKGERELTDWQRHRSYDNRLITSMNLQITGRCNYNCLHCFNAKDNHALQSHMTLEQITKLLDDAESCGIRAMTITGGEPMVHKNIREIISAIYERNMYVFDFNTNGYFITEDFLDFFKPLGIPPTMKISFDGVGFHDKMRSFKGAEERALKAIELCVKKGFPVMAQVNVNRNNLCSIPETMDLLDSMGVNVIRLIRTTESPRWVENGGECLGIKEYYDSMLGIVSEFISKPRRSEVIVWQFLQLQTHSQSYSFDAVQNIKLNQPICKGNRSMIAVGANGNVYPCLQMSGFMDKAGVSVGNIFETPLKEILQTGTAYMRSICMSVKEKAAINGKCDKCRYLEYCGTGCPVVSTATAYAERREFCVTDPDEWKCYFFEHGYYQKSVEALKGFKCVSPEITDETEK